MGNPGKFETSGKIGEELWDLSMDGRYEDECGSLPDDGPWCALMIDTGVEGANHAILWEDQQGFVEFIPFETEALARAAWERTKACYDEDFS